MSYLDTRRGPSFGSMAAVVAIHGGVAAALIIGLTVSGIIKKPDGPIIAIPLPDPPPPPVDPPKVRDPLPKTPTKKIDAPLPPLPIPMSGPTLDTVPKPFPPLPQPGTGEGLSQTIPKLTPSFPAVGAKPRNDPLRWVTTDDYRGNWIRQEMTGKARFRLEIAADGRVADCTITGSSGHPELDAATCALVSKRAKFQPARGAEGEPVAGSYSNTIDWRLPE